MKKINWLVRAKNKAYWVGMIPMVLLAIQIIGEIFGYEIELGDLGDKLLKLVNVVFVILALNGVNTDPTTEGFRDSEQALGYYEPKKGV